MLKALFLDRDGIINEPIIKNGRPFSPSRLAEVRIIPDVKAALMQFRKFSYLPVVVTNQPEVARGSVSLIEVERIHTYLSKELEIDNIYTCFHDDIDACGCRKPNPGLLFLAAKELNVNLKHSLMVGDRWKDIEAGQKAGCQCYFLDYSYQEKVPSEPFTRVSSLSEVLRYIPFL